MANNTSIRIQKQILIERILLRGRTHGFCLNSADMGILQVLASYMGKTNKCWPPFDDLILDSKISSYSTITKSIKKLESLNILKVERAHRKNNKYSFTELFLEYCIRMVNLSPESRMSFDEFNIQKLSNKDHWKAWRERNKNNTN